MESIEMQEMGQPNQVVIQEPRELAVIHEDQGPDVSQEQNVQRKVSMTTRVVKAVFLFWLDIVLLICFVPRKSRVNLRTILLVLTRMLLYAAVLVAQYGVWELLQVDRGVSQPTEFTNYMEEILGLPTNCARGKRSINGWEELLDNMRLQENENLEEQELQEKTTEVPIMNTTEIFAVPTTQSAPLPRSWPSQTSWLQGSTACSTSPKPTWKRSPTSSPSGCC